MLNMELPRRVDSHLRYRFLTIKNRMTPRPVFLLFSIVLITFLLFQMNLVPLSFQSFSKSPWWQTDYVLVPKRYLNSLPNRNPPPLDRLTTAIYSLTRQDPKIDRSQFDDRMLLKEIEEQIPSIPIAFWSEHRRSGLKMNSSCAKFPNIFDLEYNNVYWQTLRTSNGTFQLFGAYFDNREANDVPKVAVRILGMLNRIQPTVETYCQLWYTHEKKPTLVKTLPYKYMWIRAWGNFIQGIYQPYLFSCPLPPTRGSIAPQAVSLVENACDHSPNLLRVIYNKVEEKKGFAVCVKGLDFPHYDMSVRLTEWLEVLRALGADKVFMYNMETHPNVTKVLDYYQEKGLVHVTPLTLAGGQPNAPSLRHYYTSSKTGIKRFNELMPYNDCFYKHMYEYQYIALLDTDEVIVPLQNVSWKDMMEVLQEKAKKARKGERSSFSFRNVYFLDDMLDQHGFFKGIPRYMHMMQHVYRSSIYSKPGNYIKCFHNTNKVFTLHNHYPFSCIGKGCTPYGVDVADGHLQHYRKDCVSDLKAVCHNYKNHSLMDTALWRYKDLVIPRVTSALTELGFLDQAVPLPTR